MAADPGLAPSDLWKWLIGAVGALLSALVGAIWKRSNEDRIKTEGAIANMATKAELKDAISTPIDTSDLVRHAEYEQNRLEVREDMNKIHEKLDRVIAEQHSSHTAILTAIAGIKNGR